MMDNVILAIYSIKLPNNVEIHVQLIVLAQQVLVVVRHLEQEDVTHALLDLVLKLLVLILLVNLVPQIVMFAQQVELENVILDNAKLDML